MVSRRRKMLLQALGGSLILGEGISRGMRPSRHYDGPSSIQSPEPLNIRRRADNVRKNVLSRLNRPGVREMRSKINNMLRSADMRPNSILRSLSTLDPIRVEKLRKLYAVLKHATAISGAGLSKNPVIIQLPAMGLQINISKFRGFDKIGIKEFSIWMMEQLAYRKLDVPLTMQDELQKLRTVDVISSVLEKNPNLRPELDDYGIAPGTQLALPYKYDGIPFVGKGFPLLGSRQMKLVLQGWDDATGFRGLHALFHHGIYVGNGWIMHVGGGGYQRYRAGKHTDRVGLDTLTAMSVAGKGLYVVQHSKSLPRHQVMFNLLNATGAWAYDKTFKNCEHWATETVTGVPASAQVEHAIRLLSTAMVMVPAALLSGGKSKLAAVKVFKTAAKVGRKLTQALHAGWRTTSALRNARWVAESTGMTLSAVQKIVASASR